jgi:hypothetical protein
MIRTHDECYHKLWTGKKFRDRILRARLSIRYQIFKIKFWFYYITRSWKK